MKRGDTIYEGQVLRVTSQVYGGSKMHFKPAAWCIATETDEVETGVYIRWLVGGDDSRDIIDFADRFKVVPEDEWPDEVCAAMAKRALLNEGEE